MGYHESLKHLEIWYVTNVCDLMHFHTENK